jgi:HAD superfamily hydrolase (TIGR01509 family)
VGDIELEGRVAIRAVVLDIGGVLERVQDDTWPQVWIDRWERRAGVAPGHVAAALARREPLDGVAIGAVSEAQVRQVYADALRLNGEQAEQMMAEMWDAYCGELDVELSDFVARLRPRLRTAILSNSADGARREEQRRYGFEQLVDVIVYSHEVGLAKPDPAIYKLTEEQLDVAPHEIVFVDDHRPHVEAATACGWQGVLHRDTAETIQTIVGLTA